MKYKLGKGYIWLSLIGLFILGLVCIVKILSSKPFSFDVAFGFIGRLLGSFIGIIFIPLFILQIILRSAFLIYPYDLFALTMITWLYIGGVICNLLMYNWVKKVNLL